MEKYLLNSLDESISTKKEAISTNKAKILKAVELITDTIKKGNKILVCGNGGSAADSLHICGEFTNRLLLERAPLPAIPLCSDIASITSIANDYSYDQIFLKQIKAIGKKNDLLWILTTSGNSKNLINCAVEAKKSGIKILVFSGKNGGEIIKYGDINIVVSNSNLSPRIQESHVFLYHVIIELVEKNFV
jgi:D-sedoheptulose 7-phosphate isomerase